MSGLELVALRMICKIAEPATTNRKNASRIGPTVPLFLVGSSFTLAKTLRDNHEALRLVNRVKSAKTERLIREYEDAA